MNERKAAKWAKIREMGKKKYMLVYGAARYGLTAMVLFSLIELILSGIIDWTWVLIRLIVFSIIGLLVCNHQWDSRERKYKDFLYWQKKSKKA